MDSTVKSVDLPAGLSEISPLVQSMSNNEVRLSVALVDCLTIADACKVIGVNPQSVYNKWDTGKVRQLADLMRSYAVEVALEQRHKALNKAMAVKVAGLSSMDEGIRQKVAGELIEWELGKAVQRRDVRALVQIDGLAELISKVYKT